jgi:hypothetical protein
MRTPVVLLLAAALLTAAGVGGWVAADRLVGDGGGGGAVTPTPTRTVSATPSASGTPGMGVSTLLYREFASDADTLWVAPAASPADRKSVAQIEHAPEWGISASLSPDGSLVAYLALRGDNPDPGRGAEAWVLDVVSGQKRTRPVWSAESDAIVVARNGPQADTGGEVSLVEVDVTDGSENVLWTEPNVLGLYPIGYSAAPAVGGALVYARITVSGTDFGWVGAETPPGHASNESARDYHLSPDGTRVAFLARQRTDGRIAMRTFVTQLGAPDALPVSVSGVPEAVDHFNPVWRGDDVLTVGRTPGEGEASTAAVMVSLEDGALEDVKPGPEQGFDVPVAWSPDGRYLVVRSFEGSSAAQPGRERLTVIEEGSGRTAVGEQGSLEFIGWLSGASR